MASPQTSEGITPCRQQSARLARRLLAQERHAVRRAMVLRVSPSCIVRTVMDKLAIEVNLAGSQRTLSRPQEEQLERSLFRLAAAAGAATRLSHTLR